MYASGFRARRGQYHHWTIQSLTYTMRLDKETVDTLDTIRRLRNVSDYDRVGAVSKKQADECLDLAVQLRDAVEKWLREYHSELMA